MSSTTIPTLTPGAANGIRALSTLAASATASYDIDYSAAYGGWLHVIGTFGTVAATNGLQIDIFKYYGSTPTLATNAYQTWTIPGTASTTKDIDIPLPNGKWSIKLTNLDGTNALTNVGITSDVITNQATT